jgi:hypothetical protein
MGIEIANTKVGAEVVVSDNIISGDTTQRNMPAITFNTNSDASNVSQAVGINDLTIKDNIVYDWYSAEPLRSFKLGGTGNNAVNDLKVQDNDFQQTTNSKLVKLATGSNNSEVSFSGNRYADDSTSSGWFQVGSTTTSFDKWKSSVESTAQSTSAGYTGSRPFDLQTTFRRSARAAGSRRSSTEHAIRSGPTTTASSALRP